MINFIKSLLFIVLLAAGMVYAQSGEEQVEISSSVDKAKVTTGDIIRFTVTLNLAPGVELELPEIGSTIEGFRVVDFGVEKSNEDGRSLVSRWYKLQADLIGSYILPAIKVEHQGKSYATSEIFVEVASVLGKDKDAEGPKDIRDIKDILILPRTLSLLSWLIIALIVLAGSLVLFLRYRKKRKQKEEAADIPVHTRVIHELENLKQAGYLGKDDKLFHFQLSGIIREYVEDMWGLTATDMTFEEIRSNIDSLTLPEDKLKSDLLEVLRKGDLVKFTDTQLSLDESQSLFDKVLNFVDKTKPVEVQAGDEETII